MCGLNVGVRYECPMQNLLFCCEVLFDVAHKMDGSRLMNHPQPVAAAVERNQKEQMKNKRSLVARTPAVAVQRIVVMVKQLIKHHARSTQSNTDCNRDTIRFCAAFNSGEFASINGPWFLSSNSASCVWQHLYHEASKAALRLPFKKVLNLGAHRPIFSMWR